MSEKRSGQVKWFSDSRGYGFLSQDDGPDVFVHFSSIMGDGHKTLTDGQAVTFDVEQAEKGPCAVNVTPAKDDDG